MWDRVSPRATWWTPEPADRARAAPPPLGTDRVRPITTWCGLAIRLAAARAAVDRPYRDAMADRVSPGATRCEPVVAAEVPGMVRVRPAMTRSTRARPLARASAEVLVPWRSAMPDRVSPGLTTWTAADAGAARPTRPATAPTRP